MPNFEELYNAYASAWQHRVDFPNEPAQVGGPLYALFEYVNAGYPDSRYLIMDGARNVYIPGDLISASSPPVGSNYYGEPIPEIYTPPLIPPVPQRPLPPGDTHPAGGPFPRDNVSAPPDDTPKLPRLILLDSTGHALTGSPRRGCSRANSSACDPKYLGNLQDAIAYAVAQGEIPVLCDSEENVWAIVDGRTPIRPDQVIDTSHMSNGINNMLTYAGVAWMALKLLSAK